MRHECSLCSEVHGVLEFALWPTIAGADFPKRIVLQSESCVAMVTIGPVCRGHCLVLPREHIACMGDASQHQQEDSLRLLETLSDLFRSNYETEMLMFEHGAGSGTECKPCSTAHAHWHVVPAGLALSEMLVKDYRWRRVPTPFGVSSTRDYLLVGDGRAEYWVAYPESPVPSQLLRQQLASFMGKPKEWDWKAYPAVDRMLQTISDFQHMQQPKSPTAQGS